MAETFIEAFHDYAPNTQTLIYTVPAGKTALLRYYQACNTTGTGKTLTLWSGGTGTNKTLLVPTTISSGSTFSPPSNFLAVLPAGDTIYAQASAASAIVLKIDVLEID